MRIVIDMQGAQTESRFRGIGRYSLNFSKALAQLAVNHDLWVMLNSLFPNSIESLIGEFEHLIPRDRIVVCDLPERVAEIVPTNHWRARAAEIIREHFLSLLQPDFTILTSLFEGYLDDAVTSVCTMNKIGNTAVILYDLIPLLDPERQLRTDIHKRWYCNKLESCKRADVWLAISEYSRLEGIRRLGLPEDKVAAIGSAADKTFRRLPDHLKATCKDLQCFGIQRPFIMQASGFDMHKNVDGLISAFALLPPSLHEQYQLALVGRVNPLEQQRLEQWSIKRGLAENSVVFTGHVSHEDLILLYNMCSLFVLPSLYEGFGLPALEAMACGAPVIGSNTASIPEVIGRLDALFDPQNPSDLASKMEKVLADEDYRASLKMHSERKHKAFSWTTSAHRALAALESHLTSKDQVCQISLSRGRTQKKPRLAFISPLPPEQSGISYYSSELLPALCQYYDVEAIVDQPEVSDPWILANVPIRDASWITDNSGYYDRFLYQIGNSPYHTFQFHLLPRLPGVIVLHDFFLSAVYHYLRHSGELPTIFDSCLYASHGYTGLKEYHDDPLGAVVKFPINKTILDAADGVVVHSKHALELCNIFYGDSYSRDWMVIPQLLELPPPRDQKTAKRSLGFDEQEFLVCSFGFLDPVKLNRTLLDAWIISSLGRDERARLVFVGQNHGGSYGSDFAATIQQSNAAGDKIQITGYVSDELYQTYLLACDVAVQLRTGSRGETSRGVLECLAHGIPTVVNKHGSMEELPDEALVKIPDKVELSDLAAVLKGLYSSDHDRWKFSREARDFVRRKLDPRRIAEIYRDTIEQFAFLGRHRRYTDLCNSVAEVSKEATRTDKDLLGFSSCIAANARIVDSPQMLVDVSAIVRQDLGTGIQRHLCETLKQLLKNQSGRFRVEPVYLDDRHLLRYARKWTCAFLGIDPEALGDDVVTVGSRDVFLGLDWAPDRTSRGRETLHKLKQSGVQMFFVIHDILPVLIPANFPEWLPSLVEDWLELITEIGHGIVCVSDATARDVVSWVNSRVPERTTPLKVGVAWNGADIPTLPGSQVLAKMDNVFVDGLRAQPSFLMVGTVEPRKGHRQVLSAFDMLWARDAEVSLVIVGKRGWMMDDFFQALENHPFRNNRLFWLENCTDDTLSGLYGSCTALLMASEGEGFGLPLVEAARHKLPIIARDLDVFREIAGEHAYYFSGSFPEDIALALTQWLDLYEKRKHPLSDELPYLTWEQSTAQLLELVLENNWSYRVQPLAPIIEVDELVSFAAGGRGGSLIKSGFSYQEKNCRWTVGKIASIVFHIGDCHDSLQLLIDALPHAPAQMGDDYRCDVFVNGLKTTTFELNKPKEGPYRVPLSLQSMKPDGEVEVTFRFNRTCAPRDLLGAGNADGRLLGLAFRSLVVKECL